jgi:hypothetical protein
MFSTRPAYPAGRERAGRTGLTGAKYVGQGGHAGDLRHNPCVEGYDISTVANVVVDEQEKRHPGGTTQTAAALGQ